MSGGGHDIAHSAVPGPWANGAHIAAPPSLHADPNTYINRLLAYGKAPTIPDTFSSTTDEHGGGHGDKKRNWFKMLAIGAASVFALAFLIGKGKLGAARQQGTRMLASLRGFFQRRPATP